MKVVDVSYVIIVNTFRERNGRGHGFKRNDYIINALAGFFSTLSSRLLGVCLQNQYKIVMFLCSKKPHTVNKLQRSPIFLNASADKNPERFVGLISCLECCRWSLIVDAFQLSRLVVTFRIYCCSNVLKHMYNYFTDK